MAKRDRVFGDFGDDAPQHDAPKGGDGPRPLDQSDRPGGRFRVGGVLVDCDGKPIKE